VEAGVRVRTRTPINLNAIGKKVSRLQAQPLVVRLKKLQIVYGTPRFTTMFTRALHWTLY
jgi:hypothetical protein